MWYPRLGMGIANAGTNLVEMHFAAVFCGARRLLFRASIFLMSRFPSCACHPEE